MKQMMYKMAGIGLICFAFTMKGMAQDNDLVPPATPLLPEEQFRDSNGNQSEIIIRPKGDKDSKVTIEIRNGEFYVNGKPLEKFDDQNMDIEKRKIGDESGLSIITSPFRGNGWDQERFQRDLQNRLGNMYRFKSNEAFLGVSSRKTETGGATILEITKDSPAEKAGLKKGDVITKVNDETIDSPENLFESIHQYKPGEKVNITFKRDGKEQTVSAVLDKSVNGPKGFNYSPKAYNYNYQYRMPELPNLPGLESPLWGPMPPKIGIRAQDSEEGKGVNVLDITEGSAADKAGLKKGDVITSFDGNEVNSANELIQQLRGSANKSTVKLKILRNGKTQDLSIKIPHKLKTAEL